MKRKKKPDIVQEAKFTKEKTPYRTIKTSLKSIIKDPEIHNKINELVIKCNHIVIDAYMFIRLYALYKYKNNQSIPNLDADFISYVITTLGTKDTRGKQSKNTTLINELNNFYTTEFKPIFNHEKYDLKCMSFVIPYICQTMETCITTNLKEHFIKRLFRFINIFCGKYYDEKYSKIVEDDNKKYIISKSIRITKKIKNNKSLKEKEKEYIKEKKDTLWKLKKAISENKYTDIPIKINKWFNDNKNNIIPTEFKKSIPYDCQAYPFKYIKYSFYMNSKYEEFNETIKNQIKIKQENNTSSEEIKQLNRQIIKLFQPLSLRKNNVPKYITLDTASLINLFTTTKEKGKLLQSLKEIQYSIWDEYFKMNKQIFKSTKDYIFNYTIQTDGIGCSLLFKHISIKDKKYGGKVKTVDNSISYIDDLSETQITDMKTKNIICADPGKKYLLYMMDNSGNELKYSCMQRDTESLAKRNRRIIMSNKNRTKHTSLIDNNTTNIINEETKLSKYLSTTVNYDKFKEFIRVKHETNEKTKSFYEKLLYRKINWRTKTYRQKSEDKFLNNIENKFGDKKDIVVCIGDWSNKQGTCIKGTSTMGVGLKRLISKRYNTLLIDEYNTSKKCCNCFNDVENIELKGETKFRLLGCKNCKNKNIGSPEDENKSIFDTYKFLTRDKNSCINMLKIVKHMLDNKKERIKEFRRE